jgi:hypothetical protein
VTDDPNAVPPDAPDAPLPAQAPSPPPYDRELAFQIVAEELGYDPQVAKFELEETKRRRQELDRREREIEVKAREFQAPRYEPTPEFTDPQIAYLARQIQEDREERRKDREERDKEREKDQFVQTLARGMDVTYRSMARQSGMTKEQIDAQSDQFYEVLTDIYPEPEMIRALGPDKAVMTAFRLFKNGGGASPNPAPRNPRTPYVVPVGTGGGVQALQEDTGPRREGESPEDYVARLKRALDAGGAKMSTLPERAVINPG